MSAELTHEEFSKHLNTKFGIRISEAQVIEVELTEVSELLISTRQERFALIFRSPNDIVVAQGLHRFEHNQMGSFDLFIVPVDRDESGTSHEAVFNRLVKKK